MARTDDDARVGDLVARLGDPDGTDLFGRLVEQGMQDLIDAELASTIGAQRHERTETRTGQRNGTPGEVVGDPGGRRRAPDPQAASRVVPPVVVGAAPSGRSGVAGGDHVRLHLRDLDAQGR